MGDVFPSSRSIKTMLKEIFLRRLRLKRSEARVSEETLDLMTSVLQTDRAVSLHHNFTLLYFIYPFERRSGRALMLLISCESEGYDKGNIDVKDVAVTMGLLCALRLSLKSFIHTRSHVNVLLFYARTPSSAVCLLCQLVGAQTRHKPNHFILCRYDVETLPILPFL